jgi:hypothetical protein
VQWVSITLTLSFLEGRECAHGGSVVVWRTRRLNTTDNSLSAAAFTENLAEFIAHRGEAANLR